MVEVRDILGSSRANSLKQRLRWVPRTAHSTYLQAALLVAEEDMCYLRRAQPFDLESIPWLRIRRAFACTLRALWPFPHVGPSSQAS